ncbi:Hypothetical protein, predicted transmembrane protein, DUF285 family [Mycoplasmopsis agalactiae 14628]|uniref:Uncharacterized protein n=1 Tax=Mycoplasmopsis agalactiae 14628 TaxID=1110504 RepID=I5D6R0_MYCAA|nr:BspA family leucine-rich repeat surface protein [Mycoplasmopsis agalactiae]EIN15369.1 Hypothetical protein, predicted transmembrane protein, DUF285 family [Mycoplasmopsis agalactiae 14628]
MKKKLTIALSSVIGAAVLITAIAVPVSLHQKNKKPLMINNNFDAIKNPKDMNDLMIDDMTGSHPPSMKSEPVDLSSLINKASLGLIITQNNLPTEKELLDLVKKENPSLSDEALQSLSFENISKDGSTITSKNKDDFSGEIKLEYRSRTSSEQEKYHNETVELVKTTWEKSFKNKIHSLMTFGEIFDSLVKKVNRQDSKISIEESDRSIMPDSPFRASTNNGGSRTGTTGSSSTSITTTSQKEFKIKVADKLEIKLELGKITSGTVPTKYINKNGVEVSSTNPDLGNINAEIITQIGYHDHKGTIKINAFPKNVKKVPTNLPTIITSLDSAFSGLESEKVSGIESWDTSNITDLTNVFYGAKKFNQDISKWNTSNVTDMSAAFYNAEKFNSSLDNWKTDKVTTMRAMFYGAKEFNQDISSWKTDKVTDMGFMFYGAEKFNQNISKWETSNVTDMRYMFYNAKKFSQSIKNWQVSKVTTCDNFCTNSGLNCKKEKDECKFEHCPNFCAAKGSKCGMCKKAE